MGKEKYILFPEGEGCHGHACEHLVCFPEMMHYRDKQLIMDHGNYCYDMYPK